MDFYGWILFLKILTATQADSTPRTAQQRRRITQSPFTFIVAGLQGPSKTKPKVL
jgi:hypothetical protein